MLYTISHNLLIYVCINLTSSASKNSFSLYANLITSITFSFVNT